MGRLETGIKNNNILEIPIFLDARITKTCCWIKKSICVPQMSLDFAVIDTQINITFKAFGLIKWTKWYLLFWKSSNNQHFIDLSTIRIYFVYRANLHWRAPNNVLILSENKCVYFQDNKFSRCGISFRGWLNLLPPPKTPKTNEEKYSKYEKDER